MAGTINAASLKIGMDITELKASGQFASNELRSIGRIMTDLEGPTGKFEKQMQLLERAMKQAGLSEEQMAQAQEHLAAKFGVVTPAMQRAAAAADALEKQEKELADQLAFEAQILKQREALMQRGRQLTDSVRSSEEARIAKLKEYNDLLAMGAINEETHSRAIKKLDTDIQQVNSTGAMFNNFIKQNISQLMGMVAGFASVSAAANAFKQSIQLAAEFEASKAAFSVLTGSKSIAGALMVEFRPDNSQRKADGPRSSSNGQCWIQSTSADQRGHWHFDDRVTEEDGGGWHLRSDGRRVLEACNR